MQMTRQQEADNDRRYGSRYYQGHGLPYICGCLVAIRQDKDQRELIKGCREQQRHTKENRNKT